MATENEGTNIPILNKKNHESWFRQQRIRLRGKQVFYTCEQRVEEYARVATMGDIAQGLEELDIADATSRQTQKIRVNVDKRNKYEADQATALSLLFQALTEDDQALNDEYEFAYDFWAYLKQKYSQTNENTADKYMTRIQRFAFDEESGIKMSWDKLKDYGQKLVNANPEMKGTYSDKALLLILIRSLPVSYRSTVRTLNIQSTLAVDDKLKLLEENEIRLREESEEQGHVVFGKGKYQPPHKRQGSESSSDGYKRNGQCYLCSKKHMARDCPFLEIAQEAVQHAMKELSRSRKPRTSRPERCQEKKGRARESLHQIKGTFSGETESL
jgi:hypothetical protein